jgi:lauroyl/myristoyl acyltransferase
MRQRACVTIKTAPWKHEGWVSAKDLFTIAKLAGCLMAALTPHRSWSGAARTMARIHLLLRAKTARVLQRPATLLERDALSLTRDALSADYLWNIHALRELMPAGWHDEPTLRGREVLDQALERSRGAVLWCSPFVASDLAPKKVLARAAYSLAQLSSPAHPFSPTRLGCLLLNPIRLRAINQYLTRRVLVVYGSARPALDDLKRVLGANGIVLVTAIGAGTRSLTFPFMGGVLDLAVGAPVLAYESGAALIPVNTLPDPESGGYRVELGPDLTPQSSLPRYEALREMVVRYVQLLEPVVRAHPTQWEGWFHPGTWRPEP